MFVSPLKLSQCVNKYSLPHQNFKILLHSLGLPWQINNQCLSSRANDCPGQASSWHYLARLLYHIDDQGVSSFFDYLESGLRGHISLEETSASRSENEVAV